MSDSADAKKLLKQRETKAQQAREDVKSLMKQPAFRRYVGRWIADCGVTTRGHCSSSEEAHYRMGARDVGLGMEKEIRTLCFESWLQMQQEANA